MDRTIRSDPGQFMQNVYVESAAHGSIPHTILADLFYENSPQAILNGLYKAKVDSEKIRPSAVNLGKGEDFEAAMRAVDWLLQNPNWVAQAHLAAKVFQGKLDEHSASKVANYENGVAGRYWEGGDFSQGDVEDFDGPVLI